jgi:ATP-dependent exoDNAse (exonuclease V) beta subunit
MWKRFHKKYPDKTPSDVKNEWSETGKTAARLGTLLHQHIEDFYNNGAKDVELKQDSDGEVYSEFNQFLSFHSTHISSVSSQLNLQLHRTEWRIFDEESGLAGSIDCIFKDSNGDLHLYDWKRIKELVKTNKWKKFGLHPISDLADINYIHYCLQLNLYKYILEKCYDVKVRSMNIVAFRSDSYEVCEIPDMKDRIMDMLTASRASK